MDLGCYPVHWLRLATGAEPRVVSARAVEQSPGVDVEMTAEFVFPGEISATMRCSMAPADGFRAFLNVVGKDGELLVTNPLAPQLGHRLGLRTNAGESSETVDGKGTYAHQLDAFAAAVLDGADLPTGGEDAIASMCVIDAIYAASGLRSAPPAVD